MDLTPETFICADVAATVGDYMALFRVRWVETQEGPTSINVCAAALKLSPDLIMLMKFTFLIKEVH